MTGVVVHSRTAGTQGEKQRGSRAVSYSPCTVCSPTIFQQ